MKELFENNFSLLKLRERGPKYIVMGWKQADFL